MNLGKAIKICRTQRGMRQADLAAGAGISTPYLCLLEQGKRDLNLPTLEAIALTLNVPVVILVFLASNEEELDELSPELVKKLSYTAWRDCLNSDVGYTTHPTS